MTRPAEAMDVDGVVLQVRAAQIQVAQAVLRRHDALAVEIHLRNAQRALFAVEADLSGQARARAGLEVDS